MTALSTILLPVLLDTTLDPSQLLSQWVRTYHYGHISLPALSIAATSLYLFIAVSKYQSHGDTQKSTCATWKRAVLAAFVTIVMVPFTWVFMEPVNSVLFGLDARGGDQMIDAEMGFGMGYLRGGSGNGTDGFVDAVTMESVRGLVVRWGWLHLLRSCFPLLGSVLGVGVV